ncbi:MAG: TetR/AcrR family transcriptional regulator [Ktedonobacterales bacterium]
MTSSLEPSQPPDIRARLLVAAYKLLVRDGYARLSMRDVAAEVGVNHAMVHYYFGTKDQLVIAALDEANRALVARQERMYTAPGGFAAKWAQARAFYEEDLASGFVRVQMELWGASIANPQLRQDLLPRLLEWRRVVHAVVREALSAYQLDLPVSADVIATWIVGFWAGMEFAMLAGMSDEQGHFQEALDAVQLLLERLDREAGLSPSQSPAPTSHEPPPSSTSSSS